MKLKGKKIDAAGGVLTFEILQNAVNRAISTGGNWHQPVILGLEHGVTFSNQYIEYTRKYKGIKKIKLIEPCFWEPKETILIHWEV